MTDFKREERYIVVKIKDVGATRLGALRQFLEVKGIPTRECVVVEPDWPIYEIVWHLVERLATGQRLPFMTDDDPDKLKAERDALAAHVAALVEWADSYVGTTGLYEAVEAAREANTTSLDRLKAEWQADGDRLNWLEHQTRKSRTGISFDWVPTCEGEPSGFRFMRFHHVGTPVKTLRGAIDRELRRQAEGDK